MESYKIIRSRRRTIALVVNHDATLTVKIPYGVSMDYVNRFIEEKKSWITKKQEHFRELGAKFNPKQFIVGEEFHLAGKIYTLDVIPGARPKVIITNGSVLQITSSCMKNPELYIERFYKQQAKELIGPRVYKIASGFGYKYSSIKITGAKSRWGSCSHSGSLNFSWRLVMMPPEMIDYVIVHELVHLEIKNHSKRFYSRVTEIMPDYKLREKWLKDNTAMTIL